MYIYIYTYTYVYIYIYTYMNIPHKSRGAGDLRSSCGCGVVFKGEKGVGVDGDGTALC